MPIVTVVVAVAKAHEPLGGIVFVTVYVPGKLFAKSISPVFTCTKDKPAGVEEKIPAEDPGTKSGEGLAPFWQKGAPK